MREAGSLGTGTPCIRVCKMDNQSGLCSGCFRTLDEIANWLKYTDEQRTYINKMLEIRRELLCSDELQQQ
jgi:predicted Fe-S protein YdhL (DUF1289 family)